MTKEDKKKVAATLLEKATTIKVGLLRIKVKPLTLGQIFEMGEYSHDIKELHLETVKKMNVMQILLAHTEDAKAMCEIFIICAFRNHWARKVFGGYIRHHLTIMHFNDLVKYISMSFNANFFLTSISFLSQTKIMTEPTTTARGQQSEE